MQYNIRKNWVASFNLMATEPIVMLPFVFIAFLEGMALELIYYFPRKPWANVAGPIISKFFGEALMHYPGNLVILPKLFHYAQVVIYVFCGVCLTAIAVNIFYNIMMGPALQTSALIKNALKRYLPFLGFGLIVIALMFLLKKADLFIFLKLMDPISEDLPQILRKLTPFMLTFFLFLTNIILKVFLVLTIPILVIKEKPLLKALTRSIKIGFNNFSSIFTLIFLPLLVYLPLALLKTDSAKLIDKTFPELNLYILIIGIILAIFVECFVTLSTAQFLLDVDKTNA